MKYETPFFTFIRFVHSKNDESFTGAVVLHFVMTKTVSGIVDTTNETPVNVMFILVKPKSIIPKFNVTADLTYSIVEDSPCRPFQVWFIFSCISKWP